MEDEGNDEPPPQPVAQQHHPPPHQPIYGYPMDPSWAAMPPMMHHMHMPVHGYPHPMQVGGMEGMPLGTLAGLINMEGSLDPLEVFLGPFPCARLRGLPQDCTVEDVLIFLQGLVVLDVVLLEPTRGDRPGEAFVLFANPMDFQIALQRDRHSIRQRYIEVSRGRRSEYHGAIAKVYQQHNRDPVHGQEHDVGGDGKGSGHLGGPWSGATPMPIQALAAQVDALDVGRNVPSSGNNRSTAAHPGGRNSGKGGFVGGRGRGSGGGIQVGEHSGILRMRGLPFSTTKKEIFQFFEAYQPIEDSIVLTYRADGRATGEAYVKFNSPDDSERAMALNRSSMGSRYIELFISNKDEHARAMARFSGR